MNRIIEEFDLPESWFTGDEITLGEQVLLEVDVRHFAPQGWSTYKFMDPDKAAEFASQWAAKGGAVVAGTDAVDNELVGSRNLYYIFAGPLQSFYGTGEDEVPPKTNGKDGKAKAKNENCLTLGLAKKPKYKEKMKKDDKRLASQGTFSDFYEATNKPYGGMSKEEWEAEVTRLMKDRYGLDPNDFELRDYDDMSPEEFVQWHAEKYGLEELDPTGAKAWGVSDDSEE